MTADSLGIVDYTQQFDMWKAAESAGKTLGKMLEHRVTMVKSVVVDNAHRSSLALDTGDVAAGRRSMRQRLFKLVSHYGSSSVVQPTTGTSSMPNSRHAPTATPRKELPPRPTSMFVQTPMVNKALADATAEPAAAAVTILPPDRYRTRFLRTLNDYMPMVPGRWTDVSRYEC